MKIFELITNNFSIAGIKSHKSIQNYSRLNARNLIIFFLPAYNFASVVIHIICDVNTFKEYTDSAYIAIGMFSTGTSFAIYVWQTQKLYGLLDNFEEIIQQSEYGMFVHYK